jgi:hypothetical protein
MAEQKNSQTENTGNFPNQSSGGTSAQTAKDNTSLTESGAESTGTLGNVTNKVKGLYQTAADSEVGQAAKDALGMVKDNATTAIDDKKANLAQGLTSVADTIRQVGDSVKSPEGEPPANKVAELTTQYTESLSQQVEKLSGYLERQDLRGLLRDLEGFARRNPAIFLGGAFALGIVAARFLKSSNPNQALMRTPDGGSFDSGFGTTPSNSGDASTGTSTGSSFNQSSGSSFGQTGSSIGDKPDSFGETSGSFGSEADNVRPFNTGSGTSSGIGSTGASSGTGTTGTSSSSGTDATGATGTTGLSSGTGTGSTGTSGSSPTTPTNKTGGDFGSSNS